MSLSSLSDLHKEKRKLHAELSKIADSDEILRFSFDRHDVDNSGFLDREEVLAALQEASEADIDDEQVNTYLREVDSDGSGSIDFNEFKAAYKALCFSTDTPGE